MTAYSREYFLQTIPPPIYRLVLTNKSPKDEHNTNNDEGLYRCEAVSPRNVAGDAVEDVDENKEDSDEDGHSARHTLRGN